MNNNNLQDDSIYKSKTLVASENEMALEINIPNTTLFHPSLFQRVKANGNINSIQEILNERASGLSTSDITNLKSPGGYFLTPDQDNYKKNISNTSSVFKNLHGETLLTWLFFSNENLHQIQNVIKLLVFKYTNKIIDNQSKEELLIIMRSIYLEYFHQPIDYNETLDEQTKKVAITQTQIEVKRLNELVINEIIPKIISELQQYFDYIRDASKPFGGKKNFLELSPINTNIKGETVYRSITSVLLGGNF